MPTVKEKSDKNWPGLYDRFDELRKMEKVIRRSLSKPLLGGAVSTE